MDEKWRSNGVWDANAYVAPMVLRGEDHPYFVAGGVSVHKSPGWHVEERYDFTVPRLIKKKDPPPPWTCRYCGALNPGDTWNCGRCPAPRQEPNKTEASIWQPPVRFVSHEEPEPVVSPGAGSTVVTPGLDWMIVHADGGTLVLRDKPPIPVWFALLMVGVFLIAMFSTATAVISILAGSFPSFLVLASISGLCYYILRGMSKVSKARYDWGDK